MVEMLSFLYFDVRELDNGRGMATLKGQNYLVPVPVNFNMDSPQGLYCCGTCKNWQNSNDFTATLNTSLQQ